MRRLFHHRELFHDAYQSRARVGRAAGLSIILHAFLLALIVIGSIHVRRTVIFRPMIRGSSQQIAKVAISRGALVAVLATKSSALPKKNQTLRVKASQHLKSLRAKPAPALQALQPSKSPGGQSSAAKSNPEITGQGSDTQSMYPAYPTVSPSPQVRDRLLLPPTSQKIVVDVDLGTDGQVQQATLVSGLGNALDQLVLDTVHGWQFHPAMLNGKPIASRMELVFPFDKNYPEAE
jgi:TonB family protein